MTTGDMRKRIKKEPNDYPRICVRIQPELLERLNVARSDGGLTHGQLVSQALRQYLPKLEKFHKELAA